jgi:hypothetical protein
MRAYFKGLRNNILALRNKLKMINVFDAALIGFERPGGPTRRPGVRFEGRDLCENAINALDSLARWCQGAFARSTDESLTANDISTALSDVTTWDGRRSDSRRRITNALLYRRTRRRE